MTSPLAGCPTVPEGYPGKTNSTLGPDGLISGRVDFGYSSTLAGPGGLANGLG